MSVGTYPVEDETATGANTYRSHAVFGDLPPGAQSLLDEVNIRLGRLGGGLRIEGPLPPEKSSVDPRDLLTVGEGARVYRVNGMIDVAHLVVAPENVVYAGPIPGETPQLDGMSADVGGFTLHWTRRSDQWKREDGHHYLDF